MEIPLRASEEPSQGGEGVPSLQAVSDEAPPAGCVVQRTLEGSTSCQDPVGQLDSSRCASGDNPSVETMLLSLSKEIGKGFSISEKNQAEIREACEALERKLDLLSLRTQDLEDTVEAIKDELEVHKVDIQALKDSEQALQSKLEQLENSSRRNNLRVLHVLEEMERDNLKAYLV
ncbi:hypothetical protein NDU88_008833 [Pleurodeles waltl]|uniref:Uncharacterized protein n=1 Tax=Pleurodeles waltl TaxID=8319 RepID=A0AAV7NZ35_PLEWA|nr:hypothetical protein NDU88_008833 [Pleurodeles waltl]